MDNDSFSVANIVNEKEKENHHHRSTFSSGRNCIPTSTTVATTKCNRSNSISSPLPIEMTSYKKNNKKETKKKKL